VIKPYKTIATMKRKKAKKHLNTAFASIGEVIAAQEAQAK